MKKNEIIKLIFLLIIPVIIFTFFRPVETGDEMFNFQSTSKMVNGYTIYKDFNVIVTPIFFWIGALFQRIFGNYLIVFRIYGVIIEFFLYFSFYVFLRKIGVKPNVAFAGIVLFIAYTSTLVFNGASYNVLALAFYYLGMIFMLNNPSKKNNIIIGIIIYLVFMTKQNIGVFFAMATLICNLALFKKEGIKYTVTEFLIAGVLILASALAMIINGNFYQFIDYAFMGIKSFAIKNLLIQENLSEMLTTIIIATLINILFIRNIIKTKNKQYYVVLIYSILAIFIAYPIFNYTHLALGFSITMFELIIILDKVFDKGCSDEEYKQKIKKLGLMNMDICINMIQIFIFIMLSIDIFGYLFESSTLIMINNEKSPYFGCVIEKETNEKIEMICKYIELKKNESKKVVFFTDDACLYTPILKNNNGDLDLPFNGNLGKKGTEGLINKIDKTENVQILVQKENFCKIKQMPEEVKNYIEKNFRIVEEFSEYNVFEK